MTHLLSLSHVHFQYLQTRQTILNDFSLDIDQHEIVVVLGASGSGKSTLLNLIAGFDQPHSGQVLFNGEPVKRPSAQRGVVFQDDALLPWQTVAQNVGFGPKLQGKKSTDIAKIVADVLQLVGLAGAEKRSIDQLSGGQRQRVGLARALAADPQLLLMDEPFAALDVLIREQMQKLLLEVWQQTGKTIFLITHDIEEALLLATRLIILAPSPQGIISEASLPFSQRIIDGENFDDVKHSPNFLRHKNHVKAQLFACLQSHALSHGDPDADVKSAVKEAVYVS